MLEEFAFAAYLAGRGRRLVPGARAGDRDLRRAGRRGVGRPVHAHPRAVALVRRQRRGRAADGGRGGRDPGAARRDARAGARLQRAVPDRDARRGCRGGAAVGRARAGASRRGSATTASVPTRWSTSAPCAAARPPRRRGEAARGVRHRGRGRRPARGDACARRTSGTTSCARCGRARRCEYARAGARLRRGVRGARVRLVHRVTIVAWLRLRAGAWDEAERRAARRVERGSHASPRCSLKTVLAELAVRRGDDDAAARLAERRRAGRPRGRAAAHRAACSSSRSSGR